MSSAFWAKVRKFFSLLDTNGKGAIEPSDVRAKMTKVLTAMHKEQAAQNAKFGVDEADVKNVEEEGGSTCPLHPSLITCAVISAEQPYAYTDTPIQQYPIASVDTFLSPNRRPNQERSGCHRADAI